MFFFPMCGCIDTSLVPVHTRFVTIFKEKCFFPFLSVRRLIEGKEYQFRVLAENLYGTSDPCEESDSVLIQEAKIDIDYDKLGTCLLFTQFSNYIRSFPKSHLSN